jgi:tetratricopeptide (TPR) repeat protein
MIGYCIEFNNEKFQIQNYNKISCCINHLLNLYDISNNNLLTNKFGIYLLKTCNHFYKKKKFFNQESFYLLQSPSNNLGITIEMIYKLIEIITKYSSYYYSNNKHDYAKLLISSGIEIINQSPFKNEKKMIKRKNALSNNIACIYEKEKRYDKAEMFLDKCIEMNKSKIDNAISYNNYGIIELKKKNIQMSIHYFHLMFKEIKDILNEDIKEENKSEVNLLFCFLLLNYFSITKNYSLKDYNKDIEKACIFTKKILGENHYITIKLIKLKGDNIFDLFNEQNLKKLNTLDADSSSEDEFNYNKKKNKKIDFNYSNNYSNIYIEDDDLVKKEKNSFFKSFDEKNESNEIRQSGTFNNNIIFEKIDTKIQKDDFIKINDNNNIKSCEENKDEKRPEIREVIFCKDEAKKTELIKIATEKFKFFLGKYEKRYVDLGKNKYFLGDKFTLADIIMAGNISFACDALKFEGGNEVAPSLCELIKRVKENELKEFFDKFYAK